MSDDELADFLDVYSTQATTAAFNRVRNDCKNIVKDKVPIKSNSAVHNPSSYLQDSTQSVNFFKDHQIENINSDESTIDGSDDDFERSSKLVSSFQPIESFSCNKVVSSDITTEKNTSDDDIMVCEDESGSAPGKRPIFTRSHKRKRRQNANSLSDELTDIEILAEENSPVLIKRRNRQRETAEKKVLVLSEKNVPETVICGSDEEEEEISVKVFWKSVNFVRFQLKKSQELKQIYEHFMMNENLAMNEILLTINGNTINPCDTVSSLNLSVLDFIEGGVINKHLLSNTNTEKNKLNRLVVKVQDEKLSFNISLNPNECFDILMKKISDQINRPFGTYKLHFDGAPVSATDTPKLLELEAGDVLDVIPCTTNKPTAECTTIKSSIGPKRRRSRRRGRY